MDMLKEDPQDPFLNYALALEHAKEGALTEAIRLMEGILLKDENYLGTYYQLGKFYESISEKDKATSIYRKGKLIAEKQKNRKTLGELDEALMMLDEDE